MARTRANAIDSERAAEEGPVGFEEAQRPGYRKRGLIKGSGDLLDLRLHTLYRLRSVTTTDAETLRRAVG